MTFKRSITALALILFLAGCTDGTQSGATTVLRYSLMTLATLGGLGIILVVFGAFTLIRVVPKRWREMQDRPWKRLRTASRLSIPLVAGVILLILVAPFAWYRVEVGEASLRISEIPNDAQFSRDDIRAVEILPGNSGKRIRLQMENGQEFFINESEVGADGFEMIRSALERFLQRRVE